VNSANLMLDSRDRGYWAERRYKFCRPCVMKAVGKEANMPRASAVQRLTLVDERKVPTGQKIRGSHRKRCVSGPKRRLAERLVCIKRQTMRRNKRPGCETPIEECLPRCGSATDIKRALECFMYVIKNEGAQHRQRLYLVVQGNKC